MPSVRANFLLLEVVAPPHPLIAALGVHHPLLPGVERMALAAQFDSEPGLGSASLEDVAAGTSYCALVKIWMDFCFHN